MADSYEIANVEDAAEWDRFVRVALGGSVFSSSAWLACASAAVGSAVHTIGYYKNGRLIAALSGQEGSGGGIKRFTTPVLTPHGGLLLAPIPAKTPAKLEAEYTRAAQAFITHLRNCFDYVQLSLSPDMVDVREFAWAGWETSVRYTYHLDTRDQVTMWDRVERRTRTVIRKAEKEGFVVRPTDDLNLFRRQFELIQQRQEGYTVDAAMVAEFVAQATQANLAEMYMVESATGAPAAVVAFARGFDRVRDRVYAWQAGADPAFNHTGALSLLYWKYLNESEYEKFDFVGANLPSIAFFKRGFGGDLVPYFVVEGYRRPWLKRARWARNLLRNRIGG